jgi:ABC-type transport system involved in cytochrome c biogenesis ATPase subunit
LPSQHEPVRFLSAPNGYGKSTMLRMLDDIAHERWGNLTKTLFGSATLTFDDGTAITFRRFSESESDARIEFQLSRPGQAVIEDEVRPVSPKTAVPAELPPWIRQVGPDRFRDMRYGEILSAEELVAQLGRDADTRRKKPALNEAIEEVLSRLHVHYLNANRLNVGIRSDVRRFTTAYRRNGDRLHAIEHISNSVEELLEKTRSQSGRASERAEASFPARIIQALRKPPSADQLSPALLAERYAKLREKEEQFQSLALTDGVMETIHSNDLTDQGPIAIVLDHMIAGIEKRFATLEHPARQLTLFRDTINGMLEDKQVRFVYREMWAGRGKGGLTVVDDAGNLIPLTALSSGEQQLIVMFGHILFTSRLEPGGLVLLDEPEISLHPQWQIAVTQAFRKVAEVNDCRMLLATHSPTMIGDDWSSEIALSRTQEG